MPTFQLFTSISAVVVAALLSAAIIWAIRPWLLQYALARPNARSSHRLPTPQGAGVAVITSTLLVAGAIAAYSTVPALSIPPAIFGAVLFIAVVGFADDIRSIPVLARLLLQGAAVAAVLFTTSDDVRIVVACPLWIERGLLFLAGLWFVNLVNFMDGLDWMTVAEAVPITGAMVLLGWFGDLSVAATIVAAALCGALLGFAPFNRPVAKVFLGDVGSLPVGLLLGWCLLQLAYSQWFTAALLLPLYYLADATVTLLRRVIRREPFWAAHRSHFYQRATDNGFSVMRVVCEVFALNVGLATLAIISTRNQSAATNVILAIVGSLGVALTMYRFSKPRTS